MICPECGKEMERDGNNVGWYCKCGNWFTDEYYLENLSSSSTVTKEES